jgi:hypothetical protein
VLVVPFVCLIAIELRAISTVMLTARVYYKMLPMTRCISLISSYDNLGGLSMGGGSCAFVSYCFGDGEKEQCCNFDGT